MRAKLKSPFYFLYTPNKTVCECQPAFDLRPAAFTPVRQPAFYLRPAAFTPARQPAFNLRPAAFTRLVNQTLNFALLTFI